MKNKHIVVLMGGWNSEREVSLSSGEAVFQSLKNLGYNNISKVDYSKNSYEELKELNPDLVFNALHGKYGEDGCVQGMLKILGIPYTHSGVLSSAICMDKVLSIKICNQAGVRSAEFEVLSQGQDEKNKEKINKIGKPFVIKPIDEGSSVGVQIILEEDEFNIDNYAWEFGSKMMIEKYIKGKEIQVAIIDEKAVGAIEIRPKKSFYDYECKYTSGMSEYIMPAEIEANKYQEVLGLALKCHKATKCNSISRIDFIFSEDNKEFYLLEVNTQPGFTPNSLVPKIAKHSGISFDDIVEYLISNSQINS